MDFKKFRNIMKAGGYDYEVRDDCYLCNTDKSDPEEYYDNCVDCSDRGSNAATIIFSNRMHEIYFYSYFGDDFINAEFIEYDNVDYTEGDRGNHCSTNYEYDDGDGNIYDVSFDYYDGDLTEYSIRIKNKLFSIDEIEYIAFLSDNLIGFKLKNNEKIEIKDGSFFRVVIDNFFLSINFSKSGPFTYDEIIKKIENKEITRQFYIQKESTKNNKKWIPIYVYNDFKKYF